MRRAGALVFLFLLGTLTATGCCGPAECQEENLPQTYRMRTPEDTIDFFRYACRYECYDRAYDALSSRTQDEVSRFVFSLFFPGEKVPGSDVYVRDMVVNSQTVGIIESDLETTDGQKVKIASGFLESGNVTQQILLFPEPDEREAGRVRWKLGLVESFEYGLFQDVPANVEP